MFLERSVRPLAEEELSSGPIPSNLDSLLGGYEVGKYSGGAGSNSKGIVEAEAWQPILDELREYGADFENPGELRQGYALPFLGADHVGAYELEKNIYDALEALKPVLPKELYDAAQPEAIKQAQREIIESYELEFEELAEKDPTVMGKISRFTGQLGSGFHDPFAFAPGGGATKSIWKAMFQNALISGGYGIFSESDVMGWYNSLDLDYSPTQFLANVGLQAGFGAGFTGGTYALGRGIQLSRDVSNLTVDQAKKGWEAINKTRPDVISGEDRALATILDTQEQIEQTNPLIGTNNTENAVAKTEHEKRLAQAQRSLNSDERLRISEEPNAMVNPDVLDADLPNLDGRKFRFEVDELEVDAKVFQFKSGGDEFGVTERLAGVKEWDYDIANEIMVFEYRDGRKIVADGHQRFGLARKLKAQNPELDIKLYGVLKREIDGYTPRTVMLDAAVKNISEAPDTNRSNLIIDAAKVLRIAPERLENIPPQSALVRHARNLVRLSDEAFDIVEQGIIKEEYAGLVGALITDKDLHVAAIKFLKRTDPRTMDEAEAIVRQVDAAPKEMAKQVDLFGEQIVVEGLFEERAKVLSGAISKLKKDKSAFSTINKNASRLEVEGNKIERKANQKRVQNDAEAIAYLNAVANRKGPLSDALSAEARAAKETGNYNDAIDRFIGHIRQSVERGDMERAARSDLSRSPQPPNEVSTNKSEPQQAIDEFDEPGSEAARAETENLKSDIFEDSGADEDLGYDPDMIIYREDEDGNVIKIPLREANKPLEEEDKFIEQLEICKL